MKISGTIICNVKYIFLVIEEVTAECGSYLTQQPIKMETLMVETKQKLTKHEKRRAEREYNQEKVTANTHGTYSRGRGRAIIYPDQRTSLYQRSQPAAIQPRPPPTLQPTSISAQPASIKLDIAPSPSVVTGPSVKVNEPKLNLFPTNLTPRSTDSPNMNSSPASSNQNILPPTNQTQSVTSSVTSSQQSSFADNERLLNFYPTRTQESIVPPWKSQTPTLPPTLTPTQSLTSRLTGGLHGLNDDSLSHFLNSFPIQTGAAPANLGTNQNGFSNNSLPITKPTHTVPSTPTPPHHLTSHHQPMGIGTTHRAQPPPTQIHNSSRFFGHPQLTSNSSLFDSKSLFQDISNDVTSGHVTSRGFPSFDFNPLMSNPNHASNQNGLISSLLNSNTGGPAGPTTAGQVVINDSE